MDRDGSATASHSYSRSRSLLIKSPPPPWRCSAAAASEQPSPPKAPSPPAFPLNHVFVIMMENHGYAQISTTRTRRSSTPNAPSRQPGDQLFRRRPSQPDQLSGNRRRFELRRPDDDNSPDWHNTNCKPNSPPASTNDESGATADLPDRRHRHRCRDPGDRLHQRDHRARPATSNIDGKASASPPPNITGKTIADQLVAAGLTWKSYQESLPLGGADGVNNTDGEYTNLTDFTQDQAGAEPAAHRRSIVNLYAVKHNPFVYFESVQSGADRRTDPRTSSVSTAQRLYADLASGNVPNYSFIVPNQCNDQHGRGNGTASATSIRTTTARRPA